MASDEAYHGSEEARDYDRKAEQYDWRGPEVIFGLSYAFVEPGQSVLDLGIGTGLGSFLFHKAGLRVHGMDHSRPMLEACRSKGFATDLTVHDLTAVPYPFDTASLDHAVCLGVLNFFDDLIPITSDLVPASQPATVAARPAGSDFTIETTGAADAPDWHVAIFGGVTRTGRWRVRRKINSVALFGGMDLDLHQAVFEAPTVEISGFWCFGGLEIKVPAGIEVRDQTVGIFGGLPVF